MGHIGHMGLSPMGQRDIRDKGMRWQSFVHVVHQRTLAEHGYVPVRRSVQDCATRGNHMQYFTCFVQAFRRHTREVECVA